MTWTKKQICGLVDLTSLNSFDSKNSVTSFLDTALEYQKQGFQVAAICLFPNFTELAAKKLKSSSIQLAVVAGNFPNSQGDLSTKLKECQLALNHGADEIDIVLNLGEFDDGNYDAVISEVKAFKALMPNKQLKVILETGYLKSPERIRKASELAIEGGADFIKTSTGKEFPGATIEAVEVMAKVIAENKEQGLVGLKISGGVRSYDDAIEYLNCVEKHLGLSFITPEYLRIGASSLVSNLIND
ncbi:deoxyribose-phosphate aldolase [Brumimicrobium aurantiacum]|uniref:Deoxyribose-phosphate aldolase n=1 Tax=Brumimicrobium aurantiacum TaxID=1737063 RepID=A0A3E1EX17_9FLAO|nr:deoxyribose-phosphate aldolase [Brumimicrobium aurantiacum]RFC54101.1 deoxyribose-phosphate aldolase [Brumimicrobium aurantiacum]